MSLQPTKTTSAVCGLFCPSCSIFIATHEDPEKLKQLAELHGQTVEEMQCDGCRADRRTNYCRQCNMAKCVAQKGIDFCGQCDDYPCEELKAFQSCRPHRIELWDSHQRIAEEDYEKWFQAMHDHYSCPECQTINSAYNLECRKCGATPSCGYVKRNQQAIMEFLDKAK